MALSSLIWRAVAGPAVGDQAQPVDALLGGLQQVEPHRVAGRAVHRHGEPADLADRLGHAVEQVAAVLDQPVAARGLRRPPRRRRTRRPGRGAAGSPVRARSRRTASIIASMSFMSTAPRPQRQPSRSSAANGSTCQSAAFAGTTSRWPWTISAPRSWVPCRVALDPDDDGGPAGLALHQLRVEADLGEQAHDVLGRGPLPRPGAVAVVAGVDPQQVAADLDGLVLGGARLAHRATVAAAWCGRPTRPSLVRR